MSVTASVIDQLLDRGIQIPRPELVHIDEGVDADRFEPSRPPSSVRPTVIHPGARIYGPRTLVLAGTRIGEEGPAVLDNVATGRGVRIGAGSFQRCVLLDNSHVRSAAEIRDGTILEEEARVAHGVGLKQTVLMPFVTLGSLINFCDCLLAGGTSPRDHSEVGSGFIHFNFTPFGENGDKATASLFGDVPNGVLLDQPRIFLGGSGAVVGPAAVGYGTVLAAGCVYRRDYGSGLLVKGEPPGSGTVPFDRRRIRGAPGKLAKNLNYVANLIALWHWYRSVRVPLARGDRMLELLYEGAVECIASGIAERIKRLHQFVENLRPGPNEDPAPLDPQVQAEHADVRRRWPGIRDHLEGYAEATDDFSLPSSLVGPLNRGIEATAAYLGFVKSLAPRQRADVREWLDRIVDVYRHGS